MMLLIGMKINFTKKPMNPITTNPRAVLAATLVNSLRSGLWHRFTSRMLSFANSFTGLTTVSTASILNTPALSPRPINNRPPSYLGAKSLLLADRPPGTRRWIENPRHNKRLQARPADLDSSRKRTPGSINRSFGRARMRSHSRAREQQKAASDGQAAAEDEARRCDPSRGGRGRPWFYFPYAPGRRRPLPALAALGRLKSLGPARTETRFAAYSG
ncbi:hypothetical protein AXG93_1154s1410 [Marchantia polymorpha subsp. ruderalis]|uniref:Uncharacterized protein n=1 Tax=Marchantia polymorpha subsp. ruderalis TaxID=1480154 RepID=A0A176WRE5_MARPO|nr:hypothetical protein AXG93_1154s1410 [Marchantia polymorpha subsp. ruderalis]